MYTHASLPNHWQHQSLSAPACWGEGFYIATGCNLEGGRGGATVGQWWDTVGFRDLLPPPRHQRLSAPCCFSSFLSSCQACPPHSARLALCLIHSSGRNKIDSELKVLFCPFWHFFLASYILTSIKSGIQMLWLSLIGDVSSVLVVSFRTCMNKCSIYCVCVETDGHLRNISQMIIQ